MVFPREKKMREKYEYEEKNVVIMQCIQRRFQICYPNDDNEWFIIVYNPTMLYFKFRKNSIIRF